MPGATLEAPQPQPVPRMAGYLPGEGAIEPRCSLPPRSRRARPVVPIIFYRSVLLAADTAPIDALCAALAARGLAPAPLVVPSLKDAEAGAFVRDALDAARSGGRSSPRRPSPPAATGEAPPLDGVDVPVLQAVIATTRRAAWRDSPRGLGAADLAMHVVLPELDGRMLAGAIAFKDALPSDDALAFTALGQPARAGPHRHGGRPGRRAGALAANAARASGASRC